jgi:hypothetical protein
MRIIWVLVLSIVCSAGAFATTSASDTWEGRYECDALPTQDGWVAKFAGADGYAKVNQGILSIDTLGSNQFPYWFKELKLDVTRGVSVEWRVRIKQTEPGDIASATVLGVRSISGDKLNDFVGMSIGEAAIHCQGLDVKMDAADGFHVYRLTLDLNGYKLYVDNKPTPVASGPLKPAEGSNPDRGIQFGDHSAEPDAAYEIDYIRWTTAGAFVPDATSASAALSPDIARSLDDAGLRQLAAQGNLIFAVPVSSKPPLTDGNIIPGEYAISGRGFVDVISGQFAFQQSQYHVSYDQKMLYVSIQSPVIGKLNAKAVRRDDVTVAMDDSMEIFIVPDAEISPIYQIIVNSSGTIFDQKDSDAAWNIKNTRIVNKVEGDVWTMEASIPFSDLGVAAPKAGSIWRLNLCRTFGGASRVFTGMSPTRHSYLSPRQFAYVRFMDKGPNLAMNSIGDLSDHVLDFKVDISADQGSNQAIDARMDLKHVDQTITLFNQRFSDNTASHIDIQKPDLPENGELSFIASSVNQGILYAGTYSFAAAKDDYGQNYIYTDLSTRQIKIGIHVPARHLIGGQVHGVLKLLRDGQQVVEHPFTASESDSEISADISTLTAGDYKTEITFDLPQGSKPVVLKDTYHRYADGPPPWDGNQAGITDVVPDPWTDVVVKQDAVEVWDRTYDFAGGLLPGQITSRGRKVLAAPMSILASVNGVSQSPTNVEGKWESKSAVSARRISSGKLGALRVITDTQVDFDGFTWVKCTLQSEQLITVDRLQIDIPLDRRYVTLRNLGDYRMERTGALPAESFAKDLREKPIFWLGDEAGGLQWVAESLPGWNCADWSRSLQVINDAGSGRVIARLNVIDSSIQLQGSREIAFGFVATPVKPVRKDFRSWRIAPSGSPAAYNWYIWFTEWTKWVNYPDPAMLVPQKLELLEAFHRNGVRVTPYMTLGITTPFSPEFKFYGDDWLMKPARLVRDKTNPLDPQWDIWANYQICNNSRSYRDFFAWKMQLTLSQVKTDGIYFDYGTSRMCANPLHGCGWVDNTGQKQRTYNILGTRDSARRAYVIIHKYATNNPLIVHHMSGEVDMATNAFCDIMLTGENMTGALMTNENYYNALPLDKFRAEFMGAPWGPRVMDLSQFERAMAVASPDRVKFYSTPEGQKPLQHLIGMTVVNDSLIWPSEGIKPDRLWKVEDLFGWDEKVEFFPYWDNAQYITINGPANPNVVVSIFRRGDKLMIVPFNNTDEAVTVKAAVNLQALGFANANAGMKDEYFDRDFTQQDGRMEIPVDARSFRMIILTR